MAASARVAYLARRARDYGIKTGHVEVSLTQVRDRKQKIVERFRHAVLQVAMMGKLPYTAIRDGIFAHPTLAESLNNLFMVMDSEDLGEKK